MLDSLRGAGFNIASGERSAAVSGDKNRVVTGDANVVAENVAGDVVQGNKYVQEAPRPIIPTLHQLRAPVGDFVGREKEIADLTAALRGGASAAISGISGMGGIGKTELAFYVAERLRDVYPDAQLVVDMRGTDDPPRDPADALAACIRAFAGLEQQLPDDLQELTRIYRSVLEGKRALILLDNAHDSAQARPLLPPPGSALLITSRETVSLPGMKRVTLEQLEPVEARKLLRGIASRVPEDVADRICFLCGYLPLAIRRLAVFPATLDARAEEAVCEDPGHKHLSELLRRNLVRYNEETQRYSLHDLARLFADSRMNNDEGHATRLRHAAHYLTVLAECDVFYLKGGDAIKSGIALFDVERRNIEAGQAWACRHSSVDEAAARLCNNFPSLGAYVLYLRQHPREYISWLETALAAARQLKDHVLEGRHVSNLGAAYSDLGEMRRAIELSEQALVIVRETDDRSAEGSVLCNLGNIYAELGEPRRAVEFHEQQLVIVQEIGDRRGEVLALCGLGNAYAALGETRRAVEFYEQALVIVREISDQRSEGAILGNVGSSYDDLGETQRAVEFYEWSFAIAREIGDRSAEGNALFNTSLALNKLGDRAEAIAHIEAALEIFEQIESPVAERARAQLAQWRGEA